MSLAVVSDFDGTVSTSDVSDLVLKKLSGDEWLKYDKLYESGGISYKDYMSSLEDIFKSLKTTEEQVWNTVSDELKLRDGFSELVEYCSLTDKLTISSLGLDFVVNRLLSESGWKQKIKVVMPRAEIVDGGITFNYPELMFHDSFNLKDDVVKINKHSGYKVAYIGNGTTDLEAAIISDYRFAVRDSSLAKKLDRENIEHHEFSSFYEVLEEIQGIK